MKPTKAMITAAYENPLMQKFGIRRGEIEEILTAAFAALPDNTGTDSEPESTEYKVLINAVGEPTYNDGAYTKNRNIAVAAFDIAKEVNKGKLVQMYRTEDYLEMTNAGESNNA